MRRKTDMILGALACGALLTVPVLWTSATDEDTAAAVIGLTGEVDVAVLDATSTTVDASTELDALVLTTSGATTFNRSTPVVFTTTAVNMPSSTLSALRATLYDPDPGEGFTANGSTYDDLFTRLLFTITDVTDPGAPVVLHTGASAEAVNTAGGIFWDDVVPTGTRTLTVEIVGGPTTPSVYTGKTTSVGIAYVEESK